MVKWRLVGLWILGFRLWLSTGFVPSSCRSRELGFHGSTRGRDQNSLKLFAVREDGNDGLARAKGKITGSFPRALGFSGLMTFSGALLGPFLDSFHSAFGVLQYDSPITATLWGSETSPALITAWWVPELFGLAGFIIGWLYILLDDILDHQPEAPSPSKILFGISVFTFQYWLSGALVQLGFDRTSILYIMSVYASFCFLLLDSSFPSFIASAATAIGGPLIEVGLISLSMADKFAGTGYHYNDLGESGFFPLWIVPVYFLGGPANGNLARGYWALLNNLLGIDDTKPFTEESDLNTIHEPCPDCNDTRCVPCPNW